MATKASPTRAELTNTLTKILQLLEHCPEKNLKLLTPLLPAYYITLRAIRNFGEQLPRNELQWCENLQTIAPPEELILAKNSSTEATTQADSSTTEATTQADSSTTEATTQADSSTTEATSQADSSTTEATSQDASGARDASIPTKGRRTYKSIEYSQLINDELITKMLEKNEELKSWTGNPHMFFNPPAIPELQLPETTVDERVKSFYEHAADHTANIEALKLIRRLDSVIAYFRFKRDFISDYIQPPDVQKFLKKIGIPIKQEPKHRALISFGRSLVQFCYTLSGGASFPTFKFDDINFNDIDYGFLFLDLSDKMWDSTRSYYYNMKKKALEELALRNITKISEQSGAKLAAKSLLQYRQAFIGNLKPQAQSDDQVNNSSPVAPERSSKEANSDSTIALKRSSTKRAHEDSDLDSTRAPKRAREGPDLDSTSTSESAPYNVEANNGTVASEHAPREDRLHVLFQVAKSMDQNEVSSEETIANPISGPHTMQLNNGLSLNSEDSNSVPDPNAQQCLPADPLADVHWDDEVSYINFLDNMIWDDILVDIRPFTNMPENPLPDTNGQDIYQSLLPEHIIRESTSRYCNLESNK